MAYLLVTVQPLLLCVDEEAAQLPEDRPDVFIDEKGNPLGLFSWKNWLFYKA